MENIKPDTPPEAESSLSGRAVVPSGDDTASSTASTSAPAAPLITTNTPKKVGVPRPNLVQTSRSLDKDHPDVPVPPPVIILVGLLIGIILDRLSPLPIPQITGRSSQIILASCLLAIGSALVLGCVFMMKQAKTNVQVHMPTTTMITTGLYELTRNPIYLGQFLFYLSMCIFFQSAWSISFFLPIILIFHYAVVLPEEEYLEKKFGKAYKEYKKTVPRWV